MEHHPARNAIACTDGNALMLHHRYAPCDD